MSYVKDALASYANGYKSLYGGEAIDPGRYPTLTRSENVLGKGSGKIGDLLKEVGTIGNTQSLYVEGGLFTDCCLQRPVLNLTLSPQRALANMIPVTRRNTQRSRYAYLSDISDPTGDLQVDPCDDPMVIGDISACFIEFSKGRISFMSKTLEMDKLIQRLCEGIQTDLYVVGDTRGVSAFVDSSISTNQNLVSQYAVRRTMQLIGRSIQRETLKQFWYGDPTNAALNTSGGGAKQFWGLDFLIADDYGTAAKPFVTGTNCDNLNSDIKDFEETCIGAANEDTGLGIYGYLQELVDTLTNRSFLMGYSNVEWVIVMHPRLWASFVKSVPCEMLAGACATLPGGGAVFPEGGIQFVSSNDMGVAAIRQQLQASMSIDINGNSYRVILDDSLAVVADDGPPISYTGSIYFVPLSVDGVPVLFFESADYRALSQELSPLPGSLTDLSGWTDGGLFLWSIERRNFCWNIRAKVELALYFLAPHLAGKIENVTACALQTKDVVTL